MQSSANRILVVDDDRNLSRILVNILDFEGYDSEFVNSGQAALDKIKVESFDLMLLDLALPDLNGLDVLRSAMEIRPAMQAVMISGQGDIHTAVEATRSGAYDFLEKPLDSERILVTINNALEKGKLLRKTNQLREDVKGQFVMIGKSPELEAIRQLILRAAASESKVLIEGENGTGKELVARAIYFNSPRFGEPFVAVNCAAIPENLIESELFGHKRGAFTGAVADKIGRFQMAHQGTIFLDEIGDMSLMTQAKVLRALEESTIEMVGAQEEITVDVRVIAATNRDLQKEMKAGNFREDLYYRLNVLNIHIPPLRERTGDIALLVNHYIHRFCEEQGRVTKKISDKAMERLSHYYWPGNVRELRNVVEKIVTLIDGRVIQQKDIASLLKNDKSLQQAPVGDVPLKEARLAFERNYIMSKLTEYDWNVSQTAQVLQIPRTYLYKKIKALGIDF